jgi:hypothetical protein
MAESKYISVPTGYNIYKVKGEVLQVASGMMAVMPAAVVMETLVLQGDARLVARIKPYDIDVDESEVNSDEYNGQEDSLPTEDDTPLPGPWFPEEDEDAQT